MDDKDLRLFQLLLVDNRLTHREMAEELGISVPSVHRRIQNLIEQGIFTKFTANISAGYLNAVPVKVIGTTECPSMVGRMKEWTDRDYIEKVYQFGSNVVVITLLLRSLDDLGPSIDHIRDELEIMDPTVVFPSKATSANMPIRRKYTGTKPLTALDYRIVQTLHDDARRPLNDVAEELGVSVKTVKRHFDEMVEQGAVELRTNWRPERTSGIYSLTHVDLRPDGDKTQFIRDLNERYGPRILVATESSNFPDLVSLSCWSHTMDQQVEMVDGMKGDARVALAYSRIIRSTLLFDTWRTKLLLERSAVR